MDIKLVHPSIISALFILMEVVDSRDLRETISSTFKVLSKTLSDSLKSNWCLTLQNHLTSPDPHVREVALRICHHFGHIPIDHNINVILTLTTDPNAHCRVHALKALQLHLKALKKRSPHTFETMAKPYIKPLFDVLSDSNPNVIARALKVISLYKSNKNGNLADEIEDLKMARDDYYISQVIEPNLEKLNQLQHHKPHKDILLNLLLVLGETMFMESWISLYKNLLNSDQVATLVIFMEIICSLNCHVLRYVPNFIRLLDQESPLVRHLCSLLLKYIKNMPTEVCEFLYRSNVISDMMKYPDVVVKCLGIQLMGKKCELHPRNLVSIAEKCNDRTTKVKKAVIDVLGDYGKLTSSHVNFVLDNSFLEEISSVSVWRSLSFSWNILIPYPHRKSYSSSSESNVERFNVSQC
eukprot:TRINITY_DN8755_c0_g1_i2.p1 TRINITY_DN8755_c0_g1~~TRINITY_DN8755_c0_g1_i2.p1  ORF type:complete len:446 (-),score=83.30 TRINITY_DN8755_c0_g1_i2:79-1311(-)